MSTANIPNDPVAIQRIFTSRDNNANATTYVGQEQRLWYDPITNAIYVSDGNTAGGILVGGSGNGVPGGPTNSIQYNAGDGFFGGTANIIISGNGISVVGNVSAAYFIGNGSQLTGLPVQSGTYSNANVANYLPTDTTIININSNVANTNANVANNTSNITTLQGQVYANSNVATFLADFGSNTISTSGNITGNYFIGDGSQLTNLPVGATTKIVNGNSYANIASANGNLVVNVGDDGYGIWTFAAGTGNLVGPGNASQGAGIVFSADQNVYIREDMGQLNIDANSSIYITTDAGNVGNTKSWVFGTDGNLTSSGAISITGNVTANYFIGDGSQLTNLPIQAGTYSNANVANYLPTDTTIININSNIANTDSNVANNASNISILQGQVYSNANVANYLPVYSGNYSGNIISVVGNITGSAFFGDGGTLSNIANGLGNLYVVDQTIYGSTTSGNINLIPEGSGIVNVPSLGLSPIGTFLQSYIAVGNANPGIQLLTPNGYDLTFFPGTAANILTAGNVMPVGNNIAALGDPSHRYTGLWLGAGNINLIDQGLGYNQQIYADTGNIVFANSTGALFGNFRFYDDTMALNNPAANLIIGTANSTGRVQFNRAITVTSVGASTKAFEVDRNGQTFVYTPVDLPNTQSAFNVVGTKSGNSRVRNFSNTMVQITGQDNAPARISADAFGVDGTGQNSYVGIAARAARGNVDAPSQTLTNDVLMRFTAQGWTSNGAYAGGILRLNMEATEDFVTGNTGTKFNFSTTPIGSGTIKSIANIDSRGLTFVTTGNNAPANTGITFQDLSFQNTAYISSNAVNSVTVLQGLTQNQTTGAITIDNTGVLLATGTPNQIQVNGSYTVGQTGNIILALPQDISQNSNPTFANLYVSGNLYVTGNTISGNTISVDSKYLLLANNSSSNTDISGGGIILGNSLDTYSRNIIYDLNNNRWTTVGGFNSTGDSNFYTPTIFSSFANTNYLHVQYTGHFGVAYDGNDFPNGALQVFADSPTYSQVVNWNKNSSINSSTDFVAVNNLGNTTNDINYIDLGINSSTYANSQYAVSSANDGYLYVNGGNLVIGTQTAGNIINFHTGGTDNSQNFIRASITDAGLSAVGNVTANNVISNTVISITVSATGNIRGGNLLSNSQVIATGDITGGNILTGGAVNASGNITGGNIIFGSGKVSGTGNIYAGNLVTPSTTIDGGVSTTGTITAQAITATTVSGTGNITGATINATTQFISTLLSVSGNITGGNIITSGLVSMTGNVTTGNLQTLGSLSSFGNIDSGNVRTSGTLLSTTVSATGNVYGSYYFGNGSQLTGLNAFQTVNANGTNLLATSTSGVLTVTPGNNLVITGNGITDTMTVAVSNSPTFSGNITGGNLLTGGLISATSGITTADGITATANVTGGNIRTGGIITATGNITTGGNFVTPNTIVNSGVSTTGNITANNYTGGTVSMVGNVTGTYIIATTQFNAPAISVSGNITAGNINSVNVVSASGNVAAGNVNIPAGRISVFGNVDSGNLRTSGSVLATGLISAGGNITGANISATGNISDANGLLRSLPINPQGGAYTLTANDNGNLISITSGNVTVPASVFASPFGQAVTVYNNSGTTRYITQGAGTTLRLAGTAATGNRTLTQYGLATIVCVSANTFVVSGVGLS